MMNSRTLARTLVELMNRPEAEKSVDYFLDYISKNNLSGLLPQAIGHVERLEQLSSRENTLEVSSAFELSASEIAEIRKITGAIDAEVQQHIDNNLIGGFSATYHGHVYDGSLKTQITRLKNMLTG